MNITVAGVGYVGLSLAVLLAQRNHVTAIDIDSEKIAKLNAFVSPIQDDYLEKYLAEAKEGKRELDLRGTTDAEEAYSEADYVIVAVPTNYDPDQNFFDCSAVESVIALVLAKSDHATIVIKSTIPVGFEHERDLTICEYRITEFSKKLREQLGKIFELSVKTYSSNKQREIALHLLRKGIKLSSRDLEDLREILVDEYENKKRRKDILQRLADYQCLDKETILDLIASQEQGVSRLTVDIMDKLMKSESYDLAFLKECVAAVNGHDDTGTERRLVSKILDIDVKNGVTALLELNIIEIGVKRRLSNELIRHKDQIIAAGVTEEALRLARECHKKAEDKGWRDECLQFITELESVGSGANNAR